VSNKWPDESVDHPPDLRLLRQLWPFARPYRRAFAGCLLVLAVSFGVELAGPWILRSAIDGPLSARDLPRADRVAALGWHAAGFGALLLLGTWLGWVYGRLTAWNGQRVVRDVRSRLFAHVLAAGPSFHERNPAGKLTTRVTSDVENLNELISTGVLQSAFDLLKILGVLAALFLLDVRLAVFTVAATPLVIVLSLLFRDRAQKAYSRVRVKLGLQNAWTAEVVGGTRITRAFGRQDHVLREYAARNHDTAEGWRETVFHFSLFFSLVDLALRFTTIGMLWFGGSAVLEGSLAPGQFVQFWLYFGMLSAPIKELGEKYNVLQAAFASAERIVQILGEPVQPKPPTAPRTAPRRGAASIRFEHVGFAYEPTRPVLADVDFEARPGERVAVVGPSGAGKSTLLMLVSRLRDVSSGRVLVDGIDVREWDLSSLRHRVGVVSQDLFLFTGTVLDNVRLFDPAVDEARAWRALELVGIADFVRALPGGIHARVEERGATFSQGERQLLSFARALAVEPDVLVLDEATASIDSAAEERLQRALQVALQGRTALVVAHRLSTVRDADRILVLEHGRVVESGSHRELVERRGSYHRMLQALATSGPGTETGPDTARQAPVAP
jgi:ABC-type multidrug transport system fused ATPase/permease subunit